MAITIQNEAKDFGGKKDILQPAQEVKKEKKGFLSHITLTKVPAREKLFFVQQLGVMVKTGISLSVGLNTLGQETKNKRFKTALKDIQEHVEKGQQFSEGLQKHPDIFSELFINMVRAGESSGRLEEVLKELYVQMKKDHEIVSKVRGAMIYPVIVITAMFAIGTIVILFVIPNILNLFKEIGGKLPLPTQILIWLSDFITQFGIFVFAGLAAVAVFFVRFIKGQKGRRLFHSFLLKAPITGNIIRKISLARFSRTLSSLLKTDIPLIQSFEITSKVLGNVLYREALETARGKIQKGLSIHDSLESYRNLFPPLVLQMIHVGEETGSLDTILSQSADFFEDEVDQIMKNLPTVIEPVLILVLGVAVACMAVAVIMPLYSLSEQI